MSNAINIKKAQDILDVASCHGAELEPEAKILFPEVLLTNDGCMELATANPYTYEEIRNYFN